MIEVMSLIEKPRAQQSILRNSAVYTFAEPERRGVILLGVINRLQRLWSNALDVPQVKKFMRCDAGEMRQIPAKIIFRQGDGGAKGMLHPAGRRIRCVINEEITLKWAVVHPSCFSRDNLLNDRNDRQQLRRGILGIHDHAVAPAITGNVLLLERAELDRRIYELIVILRLIRLFALPERSCNLPICGNRSEEHTSE